MNKQQRQELEKRIASVEETLQLLKHQESYLLEAMSMHSYDHHEKLLNQWVREIIIGCEYIIRLEESLTILKATLQPRRKRGGKKKD